MEYNMITKFKLYENRDAIFKKKFPYEHERRIISSLFSKVTLPKTENDVLEVIDIIEKYDIPTNIIWDDISLLEESIHPQKYTNVDRRYEISKYLIDNGADIHFINKQGNTLLWDTSDVRIFKMLVDGGVDIDHVGRWDQTILIDLVYNFGQQTRDWQFEEIVLLLNKGVDIFKKDSDKKEFYDYLTQIDINTFKRQYPVEWNEINMKKNTKKYGI